MADFAHKAKFADATALKESDKALFVEIEGEERWIPKSQIDDDSEVFANGHSGMLVVNEWWAEKEGLI
jgi:hypothetical protein